MPAGARFWVLCVCVLVLVLVLVLGVCGAVCVREGEPVLDCVPRCAWLCVNVCPQELGAAFGAGDLPHAAELTTQLRYITRIKEAIADKL